MGISTLIKTLTASGSDSLDFVDGTSDVVFDDTYDEYMFVCTDINPATDSQPFQFQFNAAGASGFNESVLTTYFRSSNPESAATGLLEYVTSLDQQNTTGYVNVTLAQGSGADESCVMILHVFSPSSTTYHTHFYATANEHHSSVYSMHNHAAGYVLATAAVDEISFRFASGAFDGVIQMYGIA